MFNILKKLIQKLFSRHKKETRSSQRTFNVKVYTNTPSEHLDECSGDKTFEKDKKGELEKESEQPSISVKAAVEISSDESSDNEIIDVESLELEEENDQITVPTEEIGTVETEEVVITSLNDSEEPGEDENVRDDKIEELELGEESDQSSGFVEEAVEISSDESSDNEIIDVESLELEEENDQITVPTEEIGTVETEEVVITSLNDSEEPGEDENVRDDKIEELELGEESDQSSGFVEEAVEISSDESTDNEITEKVSLELEEDDQITVSIEESETVETGEDTVTNLDDSGEDDEKEELIPEEESEQPTAYVEEAVESSLEESSDNEVIEKTESEQKQTGISATEEENIEVSEVQDVTQSFEEEEDEDNLTIEEALESMKKKKRVRRTKTLEIKEPVEQVVVDTSNLDMKYQNIDVDINDFDTMMNQLVGKLSADKLIGLDLLQIAGNDELKKKIHARAIGHLKVNYNKSSVVLYEGINEIVVSLVIIALDHYDGSLWDHVQDEYNNLYVGRSEQRVNALIRKILAQSSNEPNNRYINYVIRQTITPSYFVPDFITFAFDIYKDTFKYELIDNSNILNEVLANVFIDISSKYESKNNQFKSKAKSYKLIKTIRDIIDNIDWFSELIEYTKIILKYLDTYYWNESKRNLPYFDYFEPFFKDWISKNKIFFEAKERSNHEKVQWNATYSLKGVNVLLHIPDHLISREYPANSIRIVVSHGSEVVKVIDRPTITEVVGSNLIIGNDVVLENPIGKVNYKIYSNSDVIFDSKKTLYREFLFFSENHNEIKQGSKYVGNIDVVGTDIKAIKNIEVYYTNQFYSIGNLVLNEHESIMMDDRAVYTSYSDDKMLVGTKSTKAYISESIHHLDIYTEVLGLIFTCPKMDDKRIQLQVNNSRYLITDLSERGIGDYTICEMSLDGYTVQGFNYIAVKELNTDSTLFKQSYFYCPEYTHKCKLHNDEIVLNINCNLVEGKEYIADTKKDNMFELPFTSQYFESELYLVPKVDIPVYRIEDGVWKPFREEISIKDITTYSKIWIDGIDFSQVKVSLPNKFVTDKLAVNYRDNKAYLPCAMIKGLESNGYAKCSINFYKDSLSVDSLNVYYRAVVDYKSMYMKYENDDSVSISFNYFGKDDITVKLFKGEECVCDVTTTDKPVHIKVPNIEKFTAYKIQILGGTNDIFSMNANQYNMYRKENIFFYDANDIVGHTFNIDQGRGEVYDQDNDEWYDKKLSFKYTTVHVDSMIEEDLYKVTVKHFDQKRRYKNNLQLLLTSEIVDGKFWCDISSEGDLLLYDNIAKSIVFIENKSTRKNLDIQEYRISYVE